MEITELVWERHDSVSRQMWVPQFNRCRSQHHVAPFISLTPSSTGREKSYLAAKTRALILYKDTLQHWQSACENTDNTAVHSFIRCSEKFVVNLVREKSGCSRRWRKNHQCLRGRTPRLHSKHKEFLSRALRNHDTHTADAFNEREQRGAKLPVGIKSHSWQTNHTLKNSSQDGKCSSRSKNILGRLSQGRRQNVWGSTDDIILIVAIHDTRHYFRFLQLL